MSAFEDAVVMVTGCSSGIGAALARTFADRGQRVFATARNPSDVAIDGARVRAAGLDVTDGDSIASAVAEIIDWAGRVDILVNNAGYGLVGPMSELDVGDFRTLLETNVVGLLAVTQAVVPHMIDRGTGRVVNIGSVSGITTTPFGGAYSASKAAVHILSDAMRMELAPFGIEVVTVQPGAVTSGFGDRASIGVERYRGNSRYRGVAEYIEARAQVSQEGSMDTDAFAALVAREITRENPATVLRAGPHSRVLPLLARLPDTLRDRFLSRKFGLDSLR